MSTGDPPWTAVWAGRALGPRLPTRPLTRRTDNSGAVFRHLQVRFAKFRRSAKSLPSEPAEWDSGKRALGAVTTIEKEGTRVAGKKDRQRRLARERYLRQQARRAHRAQRWRLAGLIGAAVAVVGGVSALLVLTLGGGGKSASA